MKILMIDIGGTNVKLMASGHEGRRKVPSGRKLTAAQMVKEVKAATEDWRFEAISIGYPGMVVDGRIAREPHNLGGGWVKMNFRKAFGKPVRIINDAAMQALANYEGGRMLFIGFGTSIGTTVIVDDVIIPLEPGMLRLTRRDRFIDRLTQKALLNDGQKRWLAAVCEAIEILRDVFKPDDIVLGGGNAKEIEKMPDGCRR